MLRVKSLPCVVCNAWQMRELLAKATQDVLAETLSVDKALAVHKLTKTITDSLYSETKIAMFEQSVSRAIVPMGEMKIGAPEKK